MNKEQIIIELIKKSSVTKLCDLWDETEKQQMNQEVATVRGWLMAALKDKNEEAFDKWIDDQDGDASPRKYFL